MNLNSKHHVWRKAGTAHHMQITIPKVKCAGSSLMLWGCFSEAGTEGLIRVEEKLNTQKYLDGINENTVQSIQNLRRPEGLPSNRTMDVNTQKEWLKDNFVCPWVAQPEPELEPNQIFLEKPENVCLPRGEEAMRRIADNCQMLMSKACRIKQKRLEALKGLQLNI